MSSSFVYLGVLSLTRTGEGVVAAAAEVVVDVAAVKLLVVMDVLLGMEMIEVGNATTPLDILGTGVVTWRPVLFC